MSIQAMREWVKTHKILIGVILGLLVLSLLLTYSIGSLTKYGDLSGGVNQSDYSGYEQSLETQRAAVEANPNDYEANYGLATTLYEYAARLGSSTDTDDQAKSLELLKEAAPHFITAAENASDDLNDLAKAQMYSKAARAYASVSEDETAVGYYKKAIELAPTDLDTVSAYAQYLVYIADYDGALEVMNTLVESSEDENTIASAKSFISQIESLQSSAGNAGQGADSSEDTTTEDAK